MSILTNKSVITMTIAFGIVFVFGLFVGVWSTGFLSTKPECFEPKQNDVVTADIMQHSSNVRWSTLEDYRMPDEVRIDSGNIVLSKTTYFLSGYENLSSKIMTFTYYENDIPTEIGFERYVNGKKFESQTQTRPSNPKQIIAIYHANHTVKILTRVSRYKSPI